MGYGTQGGYGNTGYQSGGGGNGYGSGGVAQGAGYAQNYNPAAYNSGSSSSAQAPSTSPSSNYVASNSRTHTVQKGDTLYRISRQHGTSVNALMSANGMSDTLIRPGEVLNIP